MLSDILLSAPCMKLISFCIISLLLTTAYAHQPASDPFLERLLKKNKEALGKYLDNPNAFEIQIVYTKIDRNSKNEPVFTTHKYHTDPKQYFYPASTVKLPVVLLAFEKLNNLRIQGLDKYTPMSTGIGRPAQTSVSTDSSSADGLPSVAHYAKKILIASDNDAFNRLYEFLGMEYINETLYAKGYQNARIIHRLDVPLPEEENRYTNPITFVKDGKVVYSQPEKYSGKPYAPVAAIKKGKGYISDGQLIPQPFDFSGKNFLALEDQHAMLKAIFFPESVLPQQRFNLTQDDFEFLYRYMSQLPMETDYPATYAMMDDNVVKFLLFGSSKRRMPRHIRSFNKIGQAYGYLTDNAFIVDFEKGVEFFLSATVYCNSDGIFNDDRYEYDTVGLPFMGALGKVIFDYEMNRKRRYRPNLDRFELDYDK